MHRRAERSRQGKAHSGSTAQGGRSAAAAAAGRENAAPGPSPLARHYAAQHDALLLSSFNATVAAAGEVSSCWLDAASDGDDCEEAGSGARLPSPCSHRTPLAPAEPTSPTALLLRATQSAGAEGASWLMSSSPTHSTEQPSSPSLALGSVSLSLGSEQLPAASSAQRSAAAAALAAEPGSPVTLHPLQPSEQAMAASAGWWSPGSPLSSRTGPLAAAAPPAVEADGPPSPMQAVLDGTPSSVGAGGSPEQRRRHSSPFLARDCSSVDVFCPDRYSLWTRGGGLQKGAAAAGTAGSSTRLQQQLRRQQHRFAQSLEAAERGSTPSSSGGSDEAGGGGNGGLRGAFSSALRDALTWMSGRLRSHPIELSPSERASYGSCSSTRESSPLQLEPAGGSRDSPSDSRFVTPGSAGSASSTSSGCSGGLLAVAAGTAAQAGLPRRHLRYSSTEEEEAAAGRGCGSSCGSQGSVSLGAAGAAPASAGSSGRSSRCSDGGAGAAEDHGHLLASSSPSSQRPAEPALPSSPFDQPASSSGSGTGAAAQEADSAAGVAAEDSSADYQTPRCCSPEVSAEAAAYLACGTA